MGFWQRWVSGLMIVLLACPPTVLTPSSFAESLDDEFAQISPQHAPGSGEFVHGQGYGKILIRTMIFGAVPQQGVHYIPEGTDLMFALIYAGGHSDQTDLSRITIRRKGIAKTIDVDLEGLIEDGQPIPKLRDGDLIKVSYNWRRDYQEFTFFASMFSSLSSLVLSIALLTRR